MLQIHKRFTKRAIHAAIEPLAPRRLLSATIVGQTLQIVGTDSADKIVLAADKRFINILDVAVNDDLSFISYSAIKKINIAGLDGDDRIIIDSSLDPLAYASTVDGGAGDDRISTGAGPDAISGGAGNDVINAGAGHDWLGGGAGNDTLNGEAGADKIVGGKGDDVINGGGGNDVLSDTAGHDVVHGSKGDDTGTFSDSGTIFGDLGNDNLTATADATVYGNAGNDTLSGMTVFGGEGDDNISGTSLADSIHGDAGADVIHGNGGDDLIYGDDGIDQLFGDKGGDALYGGSMSDTLHGGPGNDNLYGDDGPKDKNHADDGNDTGYGEEGTDWFEPTHKWAFTDVDPKKDSAAQINLSQDPGYGSYLTGSGMMDVTGGNLTINTGGGLVKIGNGTLFNSAVPELKSLGDAGWLAMGTYDSASNTIGPGMLSASQRKAVKPVILALPPTWKLGAMTTARDDILWYRVTGEAINPSPNPGIYTGGTIAIHGGILLVGTNFTLPAITPPSTPQVSPPIKTIVDAPDSAKGVDGYYRFLAVKRGTILVGSSQNATTPKSWPLNTSVLALPSKGLVTIAGESESHALGRTFDAFPADGAGVGHGILLQDGAIWLPNSSFAFFTPLA